MAKKRKRKPLIPGTEEVEVRYINVGEIFDKLDVPEVDLIFGGRRFQPKSTISPSTSSDHNKADDDDDMLLNLNTDEGTIEDRISQLPKEILQFIISLLTFREGACTSILSMRWKNLWRKSFSCIDFDYANMAGHDRPKIIDKMSMVNERFNFTRRVDQVLEGFPSLKLDALRFSFGLGEESTTHIDKWMKFAAAQGVEELDLNFDPFGHLTAPYLYVFHVQESNSSLKYLHLKRSIFTVPQNLKGFSSLVCMTLEDVDLTGDAVQNILSDCCSLECLSLIRCVFVETQCLKFAGPSLLLKHLHISYCGFASLMKIDLHDIYLQSFELDGLVKILSIENAPHLTRLVVVPEVPVETLVSVPHIETLFLKSWREESVQHGYHLSTLPRSYVFKNLKRLVFLASHGESELFQFVYLLEACPLLQKLELDMAICELRYYRLIEELTKMISRPGSPHTNLKEIDIYGFECFPEKIELSKYLLKKAIFLERMNIYTATRRYYNNGKWILTENTMKQGKTCLKKARELLQKVASSTTSLYFCSYK